MGLQVNRGPASDKIHNNRFDIVHIDNNFDDNNNNNNNNNTLSKYILFTSSSPFRHCQVILAKTRKVD